MSVIRVAWGRATAPTALSAYDAALAAANVHNYNLISLSSVIPADAPIERVDTAPDLGPAGEGLHVVQSHEIVEPGSDRPAVAGVGWLRSESGRGIFYEVSGTDRDDVETAIREGIAAGRELRDWDFDAEPKLQIETADPDPDEHAAAVVIAAYGQSEPLL
ncbi:pyruvoyl-dependent arginine decarboxylase [Halapricum hydrolyticum]|uniref:arginine decarboxylase n=1 Tax=Halapricum hydrolyticum TaxID=2979991 RepID=A0AAE3LI78_9EURY|nr:pyruvoyl-dependent arginine decarboxylase [Halapricum hydrolyticum]MCU4718665.1 pyruvoyl-dependent arginine decarboxylase [Halapricum hydrolyticum]MCU4727649.1 pyruvoyl-dependent arginine decarboxylase [Halapricum hydrolyticum]